MAVRKILQIGDPRLDTRPLPIQATAINTKKVEKIITDLIDTLKDSGGVGLSAPQIGEKYRIIAIQNKVTQKSFRKQKIPLQIIVNPVVIEPSKEMELDWEGCLSVENGGIRGIVERHKSIEMIGFDENGKKISITPTGFKARIIQHEIDHLECKIFLQRMKKHHMNMLCSEKMWEKHYKNSWKKARASL